MGFAFFGGYVIFWIAFKCKVVENFLVNATTDISYGLYLYAWPIASPMIWVLQKHKPVGTVHRNARGGRCGWVRELGAYREAGECSCP